MQLGPREQQFVLEGLEQGTKYTVFVMAYKGDHQSRKTVGTFSTGRIWSWVLHLLRGLCSCCVFMVEVWEGIPVLGNNVIRSKLFSELKTCLLTGFCSKPHCPELWNPNRIGQEEIAHTGQCFCQTLLVKCRAKPPGELPLGRREDNGLGIFQHCHSNDRPAVV